MHLCSESENSKTKFSHPPPPPPQKKKEAFLELIKTLLENKFLGNFGATVFKNTFS